MLHHFGVLDGFRFDLTEDSKVDGVSGAGRNQEGEGKNYKAHEDVVAQAFLPVWFLNPH